MLGYIIGPHYNPNSTQLIAKHSNRAISNAVWMSGYFYKYHFKSMKDFLSEISEALSQNTYENILGLATNVL